jgi:DNA-binding HxlR family transcriptional regulator
MKAPKYDLVGATNETCPTRYLLARLDGKWKILIMYHLLNGDQRPSELERLILGVKRQVLTQQLKELEADGLIEKTSFPEVPPRVEYRLSAFGQRLEPILDQLHDLGRHYAQHVRPQPEVAGPHCQKLTAGAN